MGGFEKKIKRVNSKMRGNEGIFRFPSFCRDVVGFVRVAMFYGPSFCGFPLILRVLGCCKCVSLLTCHTRNLILT